MDLIVLTYEFTSLEAKPAEFKKYFISYMYCLRSSGLGHASIAPFLVVVKAAIILALLRAVSNSSFDICETLFCDSLIAKIYPALKASPAPVVSIGSTLIGTGTHPSFCFVL